VLWVGVSGEGLDALAGELDAWLGEELGFAKEKRPFHAHLTLGRVKNGGGVDLLEGLDEHPFGSCVAHEVVLYKSVLQRRGAEYTPLARLALSGRDAGRGA
jgi:2'-5' RNA ligase